MTGIIRKKETGEAWETVEDTGGGGSQCCTTPDDPAGSADVDISTGDAIGGNAAAGDVHIVGGDGDDTGGNIFLHAGLGDAGDNGFVEIKSGSDSPNAGKIAVNGDGDIDLSLGSVITFFIHDNSGTPEMAFFDKAQANTSAPQPVVPLTTPSVQDVINALVALGLVAQHD